MSDTPIESPAGPGITVYSSASCGYCVAAKNFLKSRGLAWREVRVDLDPAERERMVALARRTSVPLHRAGGLVPLLEANGLEAGEA